MAGLSINYFSNPKMNTMNTITKQRQGILPIRTKRVTPLLSPEFWNRTEAGRFAIIPMLLIVTACTGGIAAAFGAAGSTFQLALTAFPTILSLALVLGVAPMKAIVYLSAVSLLLDLLVLIF